MIIFIMMETPQHFKRLKKIVTQQIFCENDF